MSTGIGIFMASKIGAVCHTAFSTNAQILLSKSRFDLRLDIFRKRTIT